jgi:hypothetical protein
MRGPGAGPGPGGHWGRPGDVGENRGGLAHPVDHGFAAFAVQQVGDFRHAVGQDAAEPQQAGAAAGKAEAGPPGGRRPGPLDRGRDDVGPGDRSSGDLLAGDRVGGDRQTVLDARRTGGVGCGHDQAPGGDGWFRTGFPRRPRLPGSSSSPPGSFRRGCPWAELDDLRPRVVARRDVVGVTRLVGFLSIGEVEADLPFDHVAPAGELGAIVG